MALKTARSSETPDAKTKHGEKGPCRRCLTPSRRTWSLPNTTRPPDTVEQMELLLVTLVEVYPSLVSINLALEEKPLDEWSVIEMPDWERDTLANAGL